jgi:PAS domain S-box-containing protein
LSFVAAAGQELQAAAEVGAMVRTAASMLVPTLADVAVLWFSVPGYPAELVVAHKNPDAAPGLERQIREELPRFAPAARGRARRWNQSGPVWVRRITPRALRLAIGPGQEREMAEVLRRLEIGSLIVVELSGHGASLGWLALGRAPDRAELGAQALAASVALAQRTSLAIQTAILLEERAREASARAQAEARQRKWSQVFLHAGWGAAIIDERSRTIDAVNPEFARLHGFSDPNAAAGRLFDEIFLGPGGEPTPALLPTEGTVTYETRHRRVDDGASFPALVDLTAIPGNDGEPGYYAAYVQDLSQLKRTEERLREVERLEGVGRLAGGVAHEVNNMMTIVIGYADLVLGMPELPAEARDELRQIRQAADHAAGVSRHLLAYSHPQVLRPTVVDLNEIVSNAGRLLAPLLPDDIHLELRLGAEAESGVHVDRGQLERIIVNLALNARDAMSNGGRFELATDFREVAGDFGARWLGFSIPPGPYAILTAKDAGVGMDAETQAHLFEPFFTTKAIGKGTGLGLSTTYGIVKQSGGYIWVDSAPGKGTTFTLCFPVVPLESGRRDRRARGGIGDGASVLVVDDEPAVRSVCARLLRQQGFDAAEAASGDGALAVLERMGDAVRAVITDIVMPDMSGPELRARVEARWPAVSVVFMSGHPAPELVQRGLLAEGERLLQKPFSAVELSAAIAGALGRAPPRLSAGGRAG